MMLYLILFLSWLVQAESIQPYFPSQITFISEVGNTKYFFAIDEINQQAYLSQTVDVPDQLHTYAMQHIPYATPDSPQSKYYVLLQVDKKGPCSYTTVWKYGGAMHGLFPEHWYYNFTTFKITNYKQFQSKMIHSNTSLPDEDYWYSTNKCPLDSGEQIPCEEIFFKKNTDIPLRYTFVEHTAMHDTQYTYNYQIISIGKPDKKYFETIPTNWMNNCTDDDLGLDFNYSDPIIKLHKSTTVQIRLFSPPHRVDGNDTMILQWENNDSLSECSDCIIWTPKELYFNMENFYEYQNMTVTRVKNGLQTTLRPIMNGGGYEKLPSYADNLLFR